jgi:hypothetical protein
VNYYSAVADRPGVWPATWHVIGKDILVPPHAVYWPIMLHAAGSSCPGHPGPRLVADERGEDVQEHGQRPQPPRPRRRVRGRRLRYFLIREMNVGQDSDFSRELFLVRYNSDLANDLGNLVNRTLNMTGRFAGGVVPAAGRGRGRRAPSCAPSGRRPRGDYLALFEGSSSTRPRAPLRLRQVDQRLHREAGALEARQVRRAGRQGAAHLAGDDGRGLRLAPPRCGR